MTTAILRAELLRPLPRRVARTLGRAIAPAGSLVALAAAPLVALRVAHADPAGTVPTRLPGASLGIEAAIEYEFTSDRAQITREHIGDPGTDPLAPPVTRRELVAHRDRHLVTPRVELAIHRNLWLSLAAPIVLAQSSELELASGASRATSSTFSDGILPASGFDAANPSAPPAGNIVLRDVVRRGVSELRAAVGYAAMNQALDDTAPTWKLAAELHLAVGRTMRFDPVNPGQDSGVSTGTDELRLSSSLDRRYRYVEAWFQAFWQVPLYTRADSLFLDPGFGATKVAPAQTAGFGFGLEAYALDDRATRNRLSVALGTQITAHFEGRGYSELWQAFALAGDRRTAGPLVLDGDPGAAERQPVSHPGVSNLESYLESTARLTVRGTLGPRIALTAFGELVWRTEHAISFAGAGVDLPTCPTGAPRCESSDNTVVSPGTREVNPLSAPLIDLVGHRYHAADGLGLAISVAAALTF